MRLSQLFKQIKEANELTGVGELLRRYFAMNGFDGALTTLGVMFGAFLARVQEPRIIALTGISTAVAVAVSGFWGTYLTEKSERERGLLHLESKMLIKLRNTRHTRAADIASLEASFVDGISPLVMALVILSPVFLSFLGVIPIMTAYYAGFAFALCILFLLGVFLGRVSNQNVVVMGGKMVLAGLFSLFIAFLLGSW